MEAVRKLPARRASSTEVKPMPVATGGVKTDGEEERHSTSKASSSSSNSEAAEAVAVENTRTVSRSMVSLVASFIDRIGPLPT